VALDRERDEEDVDASLVVGARHGSRPGCV
jgi:hypothetical protein